MLVNQNDKRRPHLFLHRKGLLGSGAKVLQETVKKQKNIEIIWDTVVESINGTDQVESLSIYNKKTEKRDTLKIATIPMILFKFILTP